MYILVFLLVFLKLCNGDSDGYCGTYNNGICKNYIGYKIVWYNNSGAWANEVITKALWTEVIETLNEPCRKAAEVKPSQTHRYTN